MPADFFVLLLAVPLLPLAAWLLQLGLGRRRPRLSAGLGLLAVTASAAVAIWLYRQAAAAPVDFIWSSAASGGMSWNWLASSGVQDSGLGAFRAGLRFDALSAPLLLMVCAVSAMVHLYSTRSMRGDSRYGAYFAGLSLFTFAMLAMLVSDNLLFLFIFWELMGVCSWFLIGHDSFDRQRPRQVAARAAVKALLTTRVGDLALLLGIASLWQHFGTLEFGQLYQAVAEARGDLGQWPPWLWTTGLLIVLGALGKSAQFPLHVWLPDAMAGPTPVSAMIHAATMVAAGVYLVARSFPLFTPGVLTMLALLGAFSALLAALMALCTFDLKKVLAYSTISQLGYMIAAVGVGSPEAGLFHVFTHGMFKAGLFLGAGAVIHACHHQQDLRHLGGLRRRLPLTAITMLIFCLAIAGVPWLSGYYSKDAILAAAVAGTEQGGLAGWVPPIFLLLTAALTSLYMFRLYFLTFAGEARSDHAAAARENPMAMSAPLAVLALLSFGGAALWLAPPESAAASHGIAQLLAVIAALLGIAVAVLLYLLNWGNPARIAAALGPFYRAARARFGIDEFYRAVLVQPLRGLARAWVRFDRAVVDRAFEHAGRVALAAGQRLRRLQTGRIQDYLYLSYAGMLLAALFFLGRTA